MKYSEICILDTHGLKKKLTELQHQLGELQLKKSISPATTKDTSIFKKMRVNIAQIQFRLSSTKNK